jgi:hypothetical protein
MVNEAHTSQGHLLFREIIVKMRHDGCGGRGYSPGSRAQQPRKMPRYVRVLPTCWFCRPPEQRRFAVP